MLALFDATSGRPLALMDSIAETTLRTAAATAVAARYLARLDADSLLLIGCGNQARAHVAALRVVRPVTRVLAYDLDGGAASRFANEMRTLHSVSATAVSDMYAAALTCSMIVTCTPSSVAFLDRGDVQPGSFIGAVGADDQRKSEISPALMAAACVVVDDLEQCATIGDLHYAVAAGAMRREQVRGDLGEVVCDPTRGRASAADIVVFDLLD